MPKIKRNPIEKRIEKNFQELKQKSDIRQRYGVFTQAMLEELFKKTLTEKLMTLDEKLDWLIGKYKAHDEEHILLNGTTSDHSDRLEVIEERLKIQL